MVQGDADLDPGNDAPLLKVEIDDHGLIAGAIHGPIGNEARVAGGRDQISRDASA
jgi:hypothetical protein